MRHSIRIKLRGSANRDGPVFECRERCIPARLWRWLFGDQHSVVIFMPGNRVKAVDICEVAEGGDAP